MVFFNPLDDQEETFISEVFILDNTNLMLKLPENTVIGIVNHVLGCIDLLGEEDISMAEGLGLECDMNYIKDLMTGAN